MTMEVLKQIMKSAQEDLDERKKAKKAELSLKNEETKELPELDLLGEGEENGELTPGKSLMFAVLEVCLCLLVRQIPALNPNPGGATAIVCQRRYTSSEESDKLISTALGVMEILPNLCSPAGQCISFFEVYYNLIIR